MNKTVSILKILIGFFVIPAFLTPAIAAEKPEIFVQRGHAEDVTSVAFSPDGRYALSGSNDTTLKLWDIETGKEVRTFTGHASWVTSVAFSPDGRYALSGSLDKTLKLWEISTGREIRSFTGHSDDVKSVAFSPDGKYALSGSQTWRGYTTIKLWDVATGKEIKTKTVESDKASVLFSPDGKYILFKCDHHRYFALWDVTTWEEIRHLRDSSYDDNPVFSPDGKYILSVHSKTFSLWDVSTGEKIKEFGKLEHASYVESIAFSPDGRYALSGSRDKTLKLWDIETGKEVRTFTGHTESVMSVAFSPDGRYALSGNRDKTLKLWDIATGREIRTFGGDVFKVTSIALTPDGRYVLSADGGKISLWDIATGRRIQTFSAHKEDISSGVALSPDGKYALSGAGAYTSASVGDEGGDFTLKLWDISTGREIRTFLGHTKYIKSVAFSPDGRYALSSSGDNTLRLWEVSTGRQIQVIKESRENYLGDATFSHDGRHILAGHCRFDPKLIGVCKPETIKLFDAFTLREIKTFSPIDDGAFNAVRYIALSRDGRYVINGFLRLWEVDTGKLASRFSEGYHQGVAFSPDGRFVLSSGEYGNIELFDVATGSKIKTFSGHTGSSFSFAFSSDGRYAFSGSFDGTIRKWDISSGKEIAQFISFTDGEWIVITPEGYYNSSANGDKHLNIRIGNNVYGIDQYRATYYKPQIVEAALKLGDIQKVVADVVGETKKSLPTVATIQNIEPPFIVIKSPEDGKKIDTTNTEISLYVEDRNQTIKKVKVFVNGRLVTAEEGRGVKVVGIIPEGKKTLDLKIPVSLDIGENLIEITAFNGFSEGRKSIRIYSTLVGQASRLSEAILPNLWILSVGINKYQDKNLTPLSYAVADAEGIVEAFKKQKGKLFREINNLIISDDSSIKPTYDSILDNLSYLSKASANDIVLLFIAGHGINDDKGDFYFLPSDAVIMDDGAIKKSKAIPWRELKAILDLPSKKLIFADTCHSEGVAGKKTRGVDNDRFVKELQEANAVIFTSSRGRELSQESDKWRHGAFTYALIEGIKGKADLIKDGKISMKELDTYVSETVPQITNGAQHPITNTPDGYVNFPVAVLE